MNKATKPQKLSKGKSLRKFATGAAKFTSSSKNISPESDTEVNMEVQVRIGYYSVEGCKPGKVANEDRVSAATPFSELMLDDSMLTGYVGVYDGHGGPHCADYVYERMFQKVCETFKTEADFENGENILTEIFTDVENEYCKVAEEKKETSGSCGTVVVLSKAEALVANIGDCRAVYYTEKGKVLEETTDHRASSLTERKRITEVGGEIRNGRVHSLEPSRTFGDIDVKYRAGGQGVVATPELRRIKLEGHRGGFMIVATDGLWDKVDNRAAGKVCKKSLGSKKDADAAAKALVTSAINHGSDDDITVAVIYFS